MERWQVMWTLAFAIFVVCKLFTWVMAAKAVTFRDNCYLLLWPGLDAHAFLYGDPPPKPTTDEWAFAWSKFLLGISVFYGIARLVPGNVYWVGWVGMIGIVMILHFGIFHILSCFWRARGILAKPLMNYPLMATSLPDFWGKRWNTAFRDLTHRYLFRPLCKKVGARTAMLSVFVFSGLVHEVVISVPAGGGYGGPTLYFLLHAYGMQPGWESRKGWGGWFFTMFYLIGPAMLLFHPPFVINVVVPFMRAAGAIQ